MFRTVIIADHERALLRRNGVASRWLAPGRHRLFGLFDTLEVERFDLEALAAPWSPPLEALVPEAARTILDVPHAHVGLVSRQGRPAKVLEPGRWLLWTGHTELTVLTVDLGPLRPEVPAAFIDAIPDHLVLRATVSADQAVVVMENGEAREVISGQRVLLSQVDRDLRLMPMDLREQEVGITGQELMTADKATLRVSVMVRYRCVDPRLTLASVPLPSAALYSEAQLAVRREVAGRTLDRLLEERVAVAQAMGASVAERARSWGLEVIGVDIKDIVLPGEMKTILNQVLEAEKRAAANVITRREETAATRSLANTAKLMADNPTLMRLRELETVREIAESVQTLQVVATAGSLDRLSVSMGS